MSRARGITRRVFRGADENDPLVAWRRLPIDIRAEVAALARDGQPHPYEYVRNTASAWATAVCATPFRVVWARDNAFLLVSGAGTATVLATLLLHDPVIGVYSAVGGIVGTTIRLLFVRLRARRVLRANGAA